MQIITSLRKQVAGLNFSKICEAMEASNLPSDKLGEIQTFLQEKGLSEMPHIFMANHSWGGRQWKLAEGANPAFYHDPYFAGGWNIFTEEDVTSLFCSSHTSGSSMEATKCQDGTWKLALEVPVMEDDMPYRGAYWNAFHKALGLTKDEEQEAQEIPDYCPEGSKPIVSL